MTYGERDFVSSLCFERVFSREAVSSVFLGRGAIRDRGNTERVEDKERAVCVLVSYFCRERSFRKSEEVVSREREAGGERVRFQRKGCAKRKGSPFKRERGGSREIQRSFQEGRFERENGFNSLESAYLVVCMTPLKGSRERL